MRKVDLNTFVYQFVDEVKDFEERQLVINPEQEKTMQEWVNYFLIYSGYQEEEEEEYASDEYGDDFDYFEELQHEELVNRRKYRSFRDDDRY